MKTEIISSRLPEEKQEDFKPMLNLMISIVGFLFFPYLTQPTKTELLRVRKTFKRNFQTKMTLNSNETKNKRSPFLIPFTLF